MQLSMMVALIIAWIATYNHNLLARLQKHTHINAQQMTYVIAFTNIHMTLDIFELEIENGN